MADTRENEIDLSEMTDEELGQFVRSGFKYFSSKGDTACVMHAAALSLISIAHRMNAQEMKTEEKGVTYSSKEIGDWEIVVKQIKEPGNG